MSALLVCLVFMVFMGNLDAASVRSRREASATYLKLTALRSDEGVWTARFGEYEISIELRHHPRFPNDRNYNDTWTLKVKHTSKRFVLPEDKQENLSENEIIGDVVDEPSFQTSETRETWRELIDSIDDNDDDDGPVFRKVKSRKPKTRRQLSNKSYSSTTEKNDFTPQVFGVEGEDSRRQLVMKELVQGSTRINVAVDSAEGEAKTEEGRKEDYQEINEDPWNNIAAVIYDGIPQNFKNESGHEHSGPTAERLTDAIALPLEQSPQMSDYDENQQPNLEEDIVTPETDSAQTWQVPDDVVVDNDEEQTTRNASEETVEEPDDNSINQEQGIETDYVTEDQTVRDDAEDEEEDDSESTETDFSNSEIPPALKRIMEWFPRSRPLSLENNGYKLFPGVGWFKLVPWAERWSNARKICESENAYLAIPDSKQKVKIFLQIFKNYPDVLEKSILSKQVFVGVKRMGTKRPFATAKDELFEPDFPIWFDGEPDDAEPGEDCVTFHAEGKIRDVPCFYNLPFLCEKEPDIS